MSQGQPERFAGCRLHGVKDLLLLGEFDKRILVRGPAQIDGEIDRVTPLVKEGGYIGFCDHRVPPDVPLVDWPSARTMPLLL